MENKNQKIGRYSVEYKRWLDDDTFVLGTDTFTDKDNDEYHLEVEWHKDEGYEDNSIHFVTVYKDDAIVGDEFDCLNLTHEYVTSEERKVFIDFMFMEIVKEINKN